MNDTTIHETDRYKIRHSEHEGWAFYCQECGYQARYIHDRNGRRIFEVLDAGDPAARHTCLHTAQSNVDEMAEQTMTGEGCFDEEEWLTPELRDQIEAIFKRIDGF